MKNFIQNRASSSEQFAFKYPLQIQCVNKYSNLDIYIYIYIYIYIFT